MPFPTIQQAVFRNDTINTLLRTPQYRGSSLAQIEADIQRRFPGTVDAVVYATSAVPGWSQVPNNKGIIAILIGINSPRDPQSGLPTGQRQHKPFLKPTGALGYALNAHVALTYEKITWT